MKLTDSNDQKNSAPKKSFLDRLFNLASQSIEEFTDDAEYKILKEVIETEIKSQVTFLGGEFKMEVADESNFLCSYELYLRDAQGKTFKHTKENIAYDFRELDEKAQAQLKSEKTLKFQIEVPNEIKRNQIIEDLGLKSK